jgi:hypothetical protein
MQVCLRTTLLLVVVALIAASNTKPCVAQGAVRLDFVSTFHGVPTGFDTTVYRTGTGADVTVSMLKFYVHNVELVGSQGTSVRAPGHYLLDLTEPNQHIAISDAPADTYRTVRFTIGVDSTSNEQGPSEGVLDPRNGMYWTWATGYVFFKLEGTVQSSSVRKRVYEMHIGGHTAPYKNLVEVDVPLDVPITVTSGMSSLTINVALDAILDARDGISVAERPSVTDAKQAYDVAPRLRSMFRAK